MPFEIAPGFGMEVCGGTHGIYADSTLQTLLGKLDTTGNGGSEVWHWHTPAFPDTFYVKLSSAPPCSARAPAVWDYEDKEIPTQVVTTVPTALNARRWRILRDATALGYLLLTDSHELRWFIVPGAVGDKNRIHGAALQFQVHTAEVFAADYRICFAARRSGIPADGDGSSG